MTFYIFTIKVQSNLQQTPKRKGKAFSLIIDGVDIRSLEQVAYRSMKVRVNSLYIHKVKITGLLVKAMHAL
ncbi:hypothetical protein RchiOBHm_Chr2g0139481 [Rosa chinensis]|uniref:Uncharacterized protein n=1 Tax=Rosa chinensis TaxID=74649 RepID=A0A2P6RX60_ROSCH|nr:hypothetical protein RchiOBHm_Chr2g0139481 [Rosa chinensis]